MKVEAAPPRGQGRLVGAGWGEGKGKEKRKGSESVLKEVHT